ncbi:MAG: hypothetical protein KKA05_03750 [Alphaproteobacteria bacterium]|nr:hypothetical protein [Alphaproteobacteria bacterium]MBU0859579.1 hypothetical protein [Alphaproteobacteria bacterium]
MSALTISSLIFSILCLSALGTMIFHRKMYASYYNDDTAAVVRLVANLFVVMTSLVFGLMINSSKNTYENIDNSVHAFVTDIIVLDRNLRNYGPHADDARLKLRKYVEQAIAHPTRGTDDLQKTPDNTGQLLDVLGKSLAKIDPADRNQASMLSDIRQQYYHIVEQRWALIEKSEGTIPMPIIVMLGAWLTLIFASYGYRSPTNAVTISMVVTAAFLIAASIYVVLDMSIPFSGPVQISDVPLQRALTEINLES